MDLKLIIIDNADPSAGMMPRTYEIDCPFDADDDAAKDLTQEAVGTFELVVKDTQPKGYSLDYFLKLHEEWVNSDDERWSSSDTLPDFIKEYGAKGGVLDFQTRKDAATELIEAKAKIELMAVIIAEQESLINILSDAKSLCGDLSGITAKIAYLRKQLEDLK